MAGDNGWNNPLGDLFIISFSWLVPTAATIFLDSFLFLLPDEAGQSLHASGHSVYKKFQLTLKLQSYMKVRPFLPALQGCGGRGRRVMSCHSPPPIVGVEWGTLCRHVRVCVCVYMFVCMYTEARERH